MVVMAEHDWPGIFAGLLPRVLLVSFQGTHASIYMQYTQWLLRRLEFNWMMFVLMPQIDLHFKVVYF